jgi:peroxiredoxin Q/BCP
LQAKNAVILGVSFDPVEDNKRFAEKFNFPYPLLSDTTKAMGVQYGAAESTQSGNAKRVAYVIGPDGKVKNVFPKANTSTFAADVLALL